MPSRITQRDIDGWLATIERNYTRYRTAYINARNAGDRRAMRSYGRKMQATLDDGRTWVGIQIAERHMERQ
jgi:hypothetical protein